MTPPLSWRQLIYAIWPPSLTGCLTSSRAVNPCWTFANLVNFVRTLCELVNLWTFRELSCELFVNFPWTLWTLWTFCELDRELVTCKLVRLGGCISIIVIWIELNWTLSPLKLLANPSASVRHPDEASRDFLWIGGIEYGAVCVCAGGHLPVWAGRWFKLLWKKSRITAPTFQESKSNP